MSKRVLFVTQGLLCLLLFFHARPATAGLNAATPPFNRTPAGVHPAAEAPPGVRADKAYEDLEKRFKELLRELRKLESEAKEKLQKEIIPLLRKEIERLRQWLREFPFKEEQEPEPLRRRAANLFAGDGGA